MEPENPNPVFGYLAAYRRSSKLLQSWLIKLGLLALLGSLIPCLLTGQFFIALIIAATGKVLILAGILWGYSWRGKLRDEFRKKYSSQT